MTNKTLAERLAKLAQSTDPEVREVAEAIAAAPREVKQAVVAASKAQRGGFRHVVTEAARDGRVKSVFEDTAVDSAGRRQRTACTLVTLTVPKDRERSEVIATLQAIIAHLGG